MTGRLLDVVYPVVAETEELEGVEPDTFVECVRCVGPVTLCADTDPVKWAAEHRRTTGHDRFRRTSTTRFSVEPATP